jgi:NAD(P)-dependent dehydrogenase (short-subunit alcohol dehydrogenase family)
MSTTDETPATQRTKATGVDLSGRCALVTGSARRTGRALALALARAGADVAVHCRESREEASDVVAEIEAMGRRSALVEVDLRDQDATTAAFAVAAGVLGGLDILVNNVGTIVWKAFDALSSVEWRACIDGTLFVTLHASKAALPWMREKRFGRIINILDADADALNPVPYATAYKIGKKAAFTLTKTLAVTEAPFGITCNAVSPGTLEDSGERPPIERMPAGRYGRYEDVEHAVLFLAGEDAEYVTGAHLKVSGGYLI